ncbi:hypothetical protein [Ornithinimicrobium sediminis]|uniref:hypothetical protein n=1 Tax=Ornithinimicrobium sediminis TaxID=2904603 RepID=UPI001E6088AC|nr:hypothetical protein [Ornithinimicrobium sediminis]MCE0486745.1 hypothetical protein [Ornithinimicrobium sediminis]
MAGQWGGEVLRTTVGDVARCGSLPVVRPARERVAVSLREAARVGVSVDLAAQESVLLLEPELTAGLRGVAMASAALGRARLRLACEVAERGLHTTDGFSLVDWLAQRCPDLDLPAVRDLARLAQASRDRVHAPLLAGVLSAV